MRNVWQQTSLAGGDRLDDGDEDEAKASKHDSMGASKWRSHEQTQTGPGNCRAASKWAEGTRSGLRKDKQIGPISMGSGEWAARRWGHRELRCLDGYSDEQAGRQRELGLELGGQLRGRGSNVSAR